MRYVYWQDRWFAAGKKQNGNTMHLRKCTSPERFSYQHARGKGKFDDRYFEGIAEKQEIVVARPKFNFLLHELYPTNHQFIPRKCNLWDVLPSPSFPNSYNMPSFKSKISNLDLISLSS